MVLGCMQVLYMRLCATNCNGRDDVLEQIAMLFPVFAFKIMTNTLGFVSKLELDLFCHIIKNFILSHNKRSLRNPKLQFHCVGYFSSSRIFS